MNRLSVMSQLYFGSIQLFLFVKMKFSAIAKTASEDPVQRSVGVFRLCWLFPQFSKQARGQELKAQL